MRPQACEDCEEAPPTKQVGCAQADECVYLCGGCWDRWSQESSWLIAVDVEFYDSPSWRDSNV